MGDVARRTRTVARRDIELFTEISGDRNPIHYDDELARSSRFGGIVVQGGVNSGLLNALVASSCPARQRLPEVVPGSSSRRSGPGRDHRARRPSLRVRDDKPITVLATTITNQDGVVVLDGSAVVWRDPAVRSAVEGPEA